MSVAVRPGTAVAFLGDSTANGAVTPNTSWWAGTGFFGDQLNAAISAGSGTRNSATIVGGARNATLASGARAAVSVPGKVNLRNGAISGLASAGLLTNLNTTPSPSYSGEDIVFILIGINDILTSVPVGTFSTNYAAILARLNVLNSAAKIVCCAIPFNGEVWSAGPVWGTNAPDLDATIDSFNSAIQTAIAGASSACTYLDFRSQMLLWEVTNNPGKGASGFATSDARHWNDAGRAAAAPIALAVMSIP